MDDIRALLQELEDQGLKRELSSQAAHIDFSSNDYLGLSRDPQIRAQMIQALAAGIPLGATGSRVLRGTHSYHEETETYLAKELEREAALLFNSGYTANLSLLTVLGGESVQVFSDELNHASLIDGIRLSRSQCHVYRHNDFHHLRELLQGESRGTRRLIVTESVFSMDGDTSDILALAELCKEFDAWLILDESHATGVYGRGRAHGIKALKGVRLALVHSAGKALGGSGAFILGPKELRQLLIQKARPFLFSTALPPLTALQIRLSMHAALTRTKLARTCMANADLLRELLPRTMSSSHILPVFIPGNERVVNSATRLQKKGFDVRAVRSPTVKPGKERLRLSVKSFHSVQEIERLAKAIHEELEQ